MQEIYNSIISEGGLTADLDHQTIPHKEAWLRSFLPPYQVFVVQHQNQIAGYFYFSPWRAGRRALAGLAEVSYFLEAKYRGVGIGSLMMQWVLQEARQRGFQHLMAILLDQNLASIGLLKKHGFAIAGSLPAVVDLGDRTCGQLIMLRSTP